MENNEGITLEGACRLYEKYRTDLVRVRQEQAELYRRAGYAGKNRDDAPSSVRFSSYVKRGLRRAFFGADLRPQLDDIEAELTYMLLRESRPSHVVEISPCGGWSTNWILRALRDNGQGHLDSFDLIPLSARSVPPELAEGRWKLHLGDVKKLADRLPAKIDYLFIDSDHSAAFAEWYLKDLLPRLAPDTPVSVHDVFHTADPGSFDGEGAVLMKWLSEKKLPWFTASRLKTPEVFESIMRKKTELSIAPRIHHSQANSMVYFRSL